jgi:heat shock protein HtpX
MMHGASFVDYTKSYSEITRDKTIIPASALKEDTPVTLRNAQGTSPVEPEAKSRQQTRQLGDLMHQLNNFTFLTCACGLKLKVPPTLKGRPMKCPRCHKLLPAGSEK